MVAKKRVNPPALGPAIGYSHGVRAGNTLHIAGQIGGTPRGDGTWKVEKGFVRQFEKALENIVEVLKAEGGTPDDLVEMVVLVKDMGAYRRARKAIGPPWRRVIGKNYPAITVVGVKDLFEPGTMLEVRAVAVLG